MSNTVQTYLVFSFGGENTVKINSSTGRIFFSLYLILVLCSKLSAQDLAHYLHRASQLLESNVHAPLFALTEFWFKVCSELRPLKLGFYDPLKNLQPLKKKWFILPRAIFTMLG